MSSAGSAMTTPDSPRGVVPHASHRIDIPPASPFQKEGPKLFDQRLNIAADHIERIRARAKATMSLGPFWREMMIGALASIDHLRSALPASAPAGWRMVPDEAFARLHRAARDVCEYGLADVWAKVALLRDAGRAFDKAAAPPVPAREEGT